MLALAHALETHKTISGDDAEAALEARPGIVVDGAVYNDPEFVARLEEYHAAAAGAHRGHTTVKLALPAGGHLTAPAEREGAGSAATTAHVSP